MSVNVTVLLYVDIVPERSLMLLYYCMLVVSFASGCLVSDSSASQQSRIAAPYIFSFSCLNGPPFILLRDCCVLSRVRLLSKHSRDVCFLLSIRALPRRVCLRPALPSAKGRVLFLSALLLLPLKTASPPCSFSCQKSRLPAVLVVVRLLPRRPPRHPSAVSPSASPSFCVCFGFACASPLLCALLWFRLSVPVAYAFACR